MTTLYGLHRNSVSPAAPLILRTTTRRPLATDSDGARSIELLCSKTHSISIDSHRYPLVPSPHPHPFCAPSPPSLPRLLLLARSFLRPLATSKLINDKINWSTLPFRPYRYQSLNETRSVLVASYPLPSPSFVQWLPFHSPFFRFRNRLAR